MKKPDFLKLSNEELNQKISNRTQWIEYAYEEAANRVDELAGDDRCSDMAKNALRLKRIYYDIKSFHCDASIVVCDLLGTPMPRSGER